MFFKVAITILSLIIFCSLCEAGTPVRRCSGNHPLPLDVQIEDCQSLPCEVTKGRVNKMDMQFVAVTDETYYLKAEIHATVLGITVPFILSPEAANVCGNLMYGAYCPLYAEEDVTYHIDLPIENNTPELNLRCQVRIVDKNKDVVACFVTDLKVRKERQ
ncbi:NPC intracellular cholesterol transporter 2-like [Episyrphus balteatus]|uniref:NPC intracellular cholesterol transporter 2-like n=1 Tax=Episyrphus balteatus TaxID=286459 RepID=UPI002486B29D|nr:NPC intracellular cholesterol transporter 2-like [Episyrphus balteatus]